MEKKICSVCLVEKTIDGFHNHKTTKDGLCAICKECRKIVSKKYYIKLIGQIKIITHQKTCSVCRETKDVSEFHKHRCITDGYRSECKECRKKWFKDNYDNFADVHRRRTNEYRVNNREQYNKYFRKRYVNNPHLYAWRGMLNSVIRRIGGKKESKTFDILGYSAEDLKKHLEKLFTEGMSWDNWGKWHIDHKIPVSSFSNTDDPKIINSLDNLQPMWASDNIKKGNRIYE
jgi:hypothetical protein